MYFPRGIKLSQKKNLKCHPKNFKIGIIKNSETMSKIAQRKHIQQAFLQKMSIPISLHGKKIHPKEEANKNTSI
jgi:hypothetical protein